MALPNFPKHALPSDRAERLAIWQCLVDRSTTEERNEVLRMILKRNDILPTLPMELIIELLDHLPFFESFRLQRVCRSWRATFSQEAVVRASLIAWESHSPSDSARGPNYLTSQTNAAKLRHVKAMRCGRPFSQASYTELNVFRDSFRGQTIKDDPPQLKGTRLAFIRRPQQGCNSVVLRDLTTGHATTLYGDARETIMNIALSSTLIAFTSHSGKLYTQDFTSGSPVRKSVRLPSATIMALHADHGVVGVMLKESGTDYQYSVAIYEFSTGSLLALNNLHPTLLSPHTPSLFLGSFCISSLLMVNANDKIVDTFDYMFHMGESPDVHLEHTRYSFDGERLHNSVSTFGGGRCAVDLSMPISQPSGFKDTYTLTLVTNKLQTHRIVETTEPAWPANVEALSLTPWKEIRGFIVRFNCKSTKLAFYEGYDDPKANDVFRDFWHLKSIHHVWKDMHFHRVTPPDHAHLITINPEHESARGQGRGYLLSWLDMPEEASSDIDHDIALCVNDTFIVACLRSGPIMRIRVMNFDEDLQIAGAIGTAYSATDRTLAALSDLPFLSRGDVPLERVALTTASYFGKMAEDMGKAWKGQGGGLQSAASSVGDMLASETKSSGQKKNDAASTSLNEMANGSKKSGATVEGTSIKADEQYANQQTGSADHLGMGYRKASGSEE
ncbi:unnamed protein product [Zymoseptoria tritici ST99CH_1E4]|uniref:F-box domain-containing protein n=1 Tax=Zymoseptoria tritici ST99CH_1E4 TaxID=1276532 RepID=A0A2H1G5F8_ZYMTR|nr:unnamed protein product [Zymoseptoria tritici ST99CH_1E4]